MTRQELDADRILKLTKALREAIDVVTGKSVGEFPSTAGQRWEKVISSVEGFTLQEKEDLAECEVPERDYLIEARNVETHAVFTYFVQATSDARAEGKACETLKRLLAAGSLKGWFIHEIRLTVNREAWEA